MQRRSFQHFEIGEKILDGAKTHWRTQNDTARNIKNLRQQEKRHKKQAEHYTQNPNGVYNPSNPFEILMPDNELASAEHMPVPSSPAASSLYEHPLSQHTPSVSAYATAYAEHMPPPSITSNTSQSSKKKRGRPKGSSSLDNEIHQIARKNQLLREQIELQKELQKYTQ
jgi:hypothetical protein